MPSHQSRTPKTSPGEPPGIRARRGPPEDRPGASYPCEPIRPWCPHDGSWTHHSADARTLCLRDLCLPKQGAPPHEPQSAQCRPQLHEKREKTFNSYAMRFVLKENHKSLNSIVISDLDRKTQNCVTPAKMEKPRLSSPATCWRGSTSRPYPSPTH